MMHGWVSNNSVMANVGDSYKDAAESLRLNGEPGIIWLENMRNYGRMCDAPDYVDYRVKGSNPCVTGSTMVLTSDGLLPVTALIDTPFTAIVCGGAYPSTANGFWSTGVKPVYRLTLENDFTLDATANHKILTTKGWVEMRELVEAESSVVLNRSYPDQSQYSCLVKSVLFTGKEEEVYDCTVPGACCFSANGIIAHNCVEVSLESYELCCLVEVMPAHADDQDDFNRTLKSALLYAKTVSLGLTDWQITNSIIARNHRIGCSLTGLAQFVAKNGMDDLKVWCQEGYDCLRNTDHFISENWGVRESIKLTAIKPSGTVSILSGSTPGVHMPISRFYLRRVRISTTSDLLPPLVEAGISVEPCAMDPDNTAVVSFPIDVGEGVRTLEDTNVYEQLEMSAFMQNWWADNQVSATITFKEHEGHLLERALELYQHRLKGISFLPECTTAYPQMPYEKITEEEYTTMMAKVKPVKYGNRKPEPNDGMDTDIPDKFCSNDLCLM
jgi:ribonucleotide reductase alpha subunit